MWVRFNSLVNTQTLWCRRAGGGAEVDFIGLTWENTNTLRFKAVVNSVTVADYSVSWTPSTGTWYHIAVVRNGTVILIFIGGVSQTLTENTAIGTNNLYFFTSGSLLTIGRRGDSSAEYLNGWMDEFRYNVGVARWTTGFTPEVAAYDLVPRVAVADWSGFDRARIIPLKWRYWQPTWQALLDIDVGGVISGVVNAGGVPVPYCIVRLYWRETGQIIQQQIAGPDGSFQFTCQDRYSPQSVYVVAIDPAGGETYNLATHDRLTPV
jgi:hypothetical protein